MFEEVCSLSASARLSHRKMSHSLLIKLYLVIIPINKINTSTHTHTHTHTHTQTHKHTNTQTHTREYIQVCRHTGRQITTRQGPACRQTDERRDARTMMTAHHCCWWVDCERDGWRWWNEETQTEGDTDRCGASWSRSYSSFISTGRSEKKQMEVQRDGTSVELHGSALLSSSDTDPANHFRRRSHHQNFKMLV